MSAAAHGNPMSGASAGLMEHSWTLANTFRRSLVHDLALFGIDEDVGIEENHGSGSGRGWMPLGLLPVEPADGRDNPDGVE